MKEFVIDNGKHIVYGLFFFLSVVTICITTFSYAAENNNGVVYTRDELSELYQDLDSRVNASILFLSAYPIGSIYTSVSSTSPATLYGGTWVAFGEGKTLVGVDTSQDEFNVVEKIGGEKTHLLTTAEMPNHNHISSVYIYGQNRAETSTISTAIGFNWDTMLAANLIGWTGPEGNYITNSSRLNTAESTYVGSNQPHNNLQPYITVYMWKRTA